MASSNIKLFDENKGNMLSDSEFSISNQRMNGLQTGVASSQLQNKAMYQASLVAYAIAQVMMQNGKNANDTDAVSAFVANLSGTMLQKVYDLATTAEAQAGVATGKWMSPALVKAAIDTLAAKANNILSSSTKALYGLGDNATPDDIFSLLSRFQSGLGNEYIWEKSKTEELEDVVELTNVEIWRGATSQNNTFYVGTGFTNNSGNSSYPYKLTGTTSFSAYSQSAGNVKNNFLGKYISADSVLSDTSTQKDGVYYIPSDAKITFTSENVQGTMYYKLIVDKVTATRNHRFVTTKYGYVNSHSPNAYPPAVSDGYTYTPLGQVGSRAQIETGTYVGTGTNACSIQYERTPKFVAIFSKTTTNSSDYIPFAFFMPGLPVGVLTYPKSSEQSYCWVVHGYLKDNAFKTSSSYMDISGRTYQYIMLS